MAVTNALTVAQFDALVAHPLARRVVPLLLLWHSV
jgi:hypothetical protein